MEYRLNKIDMEVRERINETTSGGKIHRKNEIQKLKGKKNDDRKNEEKNQYEKFVIPENSSKDKKIMIISVKDNEKSIDVEAIKDDNETNVNDRGNFLDVRR